MISWLLRWMFEMDEVGFGAESDRAVCWEAVGAARLPPRDSVAGPSLCGKAPM